MINHFISLASIRNRIKTIVGADAGFGQACFRLAFYFYASNPIKKLFRKFMCQKCSEPMFLQKNIADLKKIDSIEGPLISIIIPSKNQSQLLRQCLLSINSKTAYKNYEIIVIDNGSTEKVFYELMDEARIIFKLFHHVQTDSSFNFSSLINLGSKIASGQYLVMLNNDTEVISADWLGTLLSYAAINNVGVVGCKLLYPNSTIQHAGIMIYKNGIVKHLFAGYDRNCTEVSVCKNYPAVTAAALMVSKEKFEMINGFDEAFAVDFNDIDFCLRLQQKGFINLYIPEAELVHHESVSRRHPLSHPAKYKQFKQEQQLFMHRWITR